MKTQLPNYQNIKEFLLSKFNLFEKSNLTHLIEEKLKYFTEDPLNHTIYVKQHKLDYDNLLSSQIKKCFRYQLISKFSIKQTEICNTIAINKELQIFVVECKGKIKVYEFQDEQLNEAKVLNQHQNNVNCLSFIGNSNSFISGSDDKTIRIWTKQYNLYESLSRLQINIQIKSIVQLLIINRIQQINFMWKRQYNISNQIRKYDLACHLNNQS